MHNCIHQSPQFIFQPPTPIKTKVHLPLFLFRFSLQNDPKIKFLARLPFIYGCNKDSVMAEQVSLTVVCHPTASSVLHQRVCLPPTGLGSSAAGAGNVVCDLWFPEKSGLHRTRTQSHEGKGHSGTRQASTALRTFSLPGQVLVQQAVCQGCAGNGAVGWDSWTGATHRPWVEEKGPPELRE